MIVLSDLFHRFQLCLLSLFVRQNFRVSAINNYYFKNRDADSALLAPGALADEEGGEAGCEDGDGRDEGEGGEDVGPQRHQRQPAQPTRR